MQEQEVVILIAEDDPGHARLIQKNLKRAGISNQFLHFRDGQAILDFLFRVEIRHIEPQGQYTCCCWISECLK